MSSEGWVFVHGELWRAVPACSPQRRPTHAMASPYRGGTPRIVVGFR